MSKTVTCIEAEQESSEALSGILSYLFLGIIDGILNSSIVYISIALDLIITETIFSDALLKLVSLLSSFRQVRKLKFILIKTISSLTIRLCKLRQFSELVIVFTVEN